MISKEDYFNKTYKKLVDALPSKPWIKAFARINANPKSPAAIKMLADYLMAYGINLWEGGNLKKLDEYESGVVAEAMYYSDKFLELNESMEEGRRDGSMSKFEAAFAMPSEMRSINFETFMFHLLRHRGYEVECKDDEVSGETYDFLVKNKQFDLQIECKSFAYDKGLCITGEDARDLIDGVLSRNFCFNKNPKGEVSFLTIEMREGIPKSKNGKKRVVDDILRSLEDGLPESGEKFKLYIDRIDNVNNIEETDGWIGISNQGGGSELACIVSAPNGKASRVCLRVTAGAKNSFWREFENVCKEAAKRQLKKDRPASIAVHVSNIETLDKILSDERFIVKKENIFNQFHVVSLILVSNIGVYEESGYPYFYVAPKILEFANSRTSFSNVGKVIST